MNYLAIPIANMGNSELDAIAIFRIDSVAVKVESILAVDQQPMLERRKHPQTEAGRRVSSARGCARSVRS